MASELGMVENQAPARTMRGGCECSASKEGPDLMDLYREDVYEFQPKLLNS